jgi:hypothetical protein
MSETTANRLAWAAAIAIGLAGWMDGMHSFRELVDPHTIRALFLTIGSTLTAGIAISRPDWSKKLRESMTEEKPK